MRARSIAAGGLFLAALAGPPESHRNQATASIQSLESDVAGVVATFNPKELSIDKSVPWQTAEDSTEESPALLYLGPEPKAVTVDLMFEDKVDVRKELLLLENLAREDEKLKRPPRVKVIWGNGLPSFEGVIESIGTKYTMFFSDGTPVRATCTVRVREASRASLRRCRTDADCSDGKVCVQNACQNP